MDPMKQRTSRRRFLRHFGSLSAFTFLGMGYSYWETGAFVIRRRTIPIPGLPPAFVGKKIALLSDLHHGPFVGLPYLERIVAATNAEKPDIIALAGDYVYSASRYIAPCFRVLRGLRAPLGIYAVLGNHDHWQGSTATREAIRACGFHDLDNDGRWLRLHDQRLRICGVGDFMQDSQDSKRALGDTRPKEPAIMLSHNPDYAEGLRDPRVKLILSGHTHGGQIVLPFIGAPIVPSIYGTKYIAGLIQAPQSKVFVSRGVGVIGLPFRFRCQPEICILTLS